MDELDYFGVVDNNNVYTWQEEMVGGVKVKFKQVQAGMCIEALRYFLFSVP